MSDIITNTSYCSKDFGSLYPEVLDLAKRITNEWDPSSSNESDPGVVLLKEAAFIGDHNNYNIDKNTLENFLPTATQDKSVRNIVEMNGYIPQYYVSANGNVSFNYEIPDDSEEENETFIIPKFSLVISDANNSVTYTQIEDLAVIFDEVSNSSRSTTQSCLFMQGTLNTLTVNNSTTILTENLDDNNRIYFPEVMVAQNGVYVNYADSSSSDLTWERDNYLATKPAGSRLFKVDYDSDKGLPYVEFPADISNIIGSGLIITYFSTSGTTGNVSANVLTSIVSPTVVTDKAGVEHDCSNFTLTNVSSIMNGKNPETIDEMYRSFKKVVGTFDTLVTREDYANRLASFEDELGNYVVSNAFVTDRLNDINSAANIMTADKNGNYLENISLQQHQLTYHTGEIFIDNAPTSGNYGKGTMITVRTGTGTQGSQYRYDLYVQMANIGVRFEKCNTISLNDFSILSDAMTPYDLIIYALKSFSMTDYSVSAPYKALEKSYTAITEETRRNAEEFLSGDKCINHVFKSPATSGSGYGDVYCYKNYAPLNVTITPYYKITSSIKNDIVNNIYKALSENFNPRTLGWGESLDTLAIKDVILNSDDRIRDVNITPIQYKTKVLKNVSDTVTQTEVDLVNTSTYFIDLIAKNVLAGRVCLFEFDERFNLNYNQDNGVIYNDITSLSSEVAIKVNPSQASSFEQVASESYTKSWEISSTAPAGTITYYRLLNANLPSGTEPTGGTLPIGAEITLVYNSNTSSTQSFSIAFDVPAGVTDIDEYATQFTPTIDKSYTISYTGGSLTSTASTTYTDIPRPQGTNVAILTVKETTYVRATDNGEENVNYTLHANEAIQIISPNYYSDVTYSTYVNYRYVDSSVSTRTIKAETDTTLDGNQRIILVYTKDGLEKQDVLTSGTTIRTTFDLIPTDLASNTSKRTYTDATGIFKDANFKSLTSSQTLSTRKLMMTELSNTALRCYWNVSKNGVNKLFADGEYSRILDNNEFFLYTNDTMNEMVLLGAGTKLVRSINDDNNWLITEDTETTLDDVSLNGIQNEINWQSINLAGKPLDIIEMNVITLGENDNIKVSGWVWGDNNSNDTYIDNEWKTCNGNIVYTTGSSIVTLPYIENFYLIRSRLDIVSSADSPQELYSGEADSSGYVDAQQTIKLSATGVQLAELKGLPYSHVTFQTSEPVAIIGGSNIDVSNLEGLDIYKYEVTSSVPPEFNGSEGSEELLPTLKQQIVMDYSKEADGYVGCTETSAGDIYHFRAVYPFYYDKATGDVRQWLLPIHIDGDDIVVTAKMYNSTVDSAQERHKGTTISFVDYNVSDSDVTELKLHGNDLYFLSPVYTATTGPTILYLQLEWDIELYGIEQAEIINVDNLKVVEGANSLISKQTNVNLTNILARIKSIITGSDKPNTKYYYTYDINNGVHINLDTYCTKSDIVADNGYSQLAFDNPSIMFDPANIASDKTIAQIDIRNSTINVESGMLKE